MVIIKDSTNTRKQYYC